MTNIGGVGLTHAVATDVGHRRERNEDSAYASARLLAVADGMGGHAHGEVASALVVRALAELDARLPANPSPDAVRAALTGTIVAVPDRFAELAARDEDLAGMGSTLTALWLAGDRFVLAHIGDSRAYQLRDGELSQLTSDHTFVRSLVEDGRLTEAEAATHPRRALLLRALQHGNPPQPDLHDVPISAGDRYLLCSDGLTDFVAVAEIHEVLRTVADPAAAAARLVDLANAAGGQDNVTCLVADTAIAPTPTRPGWLARHFQRA